MNQIINEKKFIAERTGIPYANLSQAYLRAETVLGSLSQYSFQLQGNNVASPTITERLLNLNDEFVMTHLTIAVKSVTTAGTTPTDAEQLDTPLFTYSAATVFTTNVEPVFNGSFSLTIDRKEFLPQFPCRFFKRVPDTQVSTTNGTVPSFTNGLYGFAPFEPVKIDGRQTINAVLDLGAAATMAGAAGFTNYAVLEVRGYLVVNAKS
jgi:hypothetical protein